MRCASLGCAGVTDGQTYCRRHGGADAEYDELPEWHFGDNPYDDPAIDHFLDLWYGQEFSPSGKDRGLD